MIVNFETYLTQLNSLLIELRTNFVLLDKEWVSKLKAQIMYMNPKVANNLWEYHKNYFKLVRFSEYDYEIYLLAASRNELTRLGDYVNSIDLMTTDNNSLLFQILFENKRFNCFNYAFLEGIFEFLQSKDKIFSEYRKAHNLSKNDNYALLAHFLGYKTKISVYKKLQQFEFGTKLPDLKQLFWVVSTLLALCSNEVEQNHLLKQIFERIKIKEMFLVRKNNNFDYMQQFTKVLWKWLLEIKKLAWSQSKWYNGG